jgi:hypothetical protein
MGDSSVSDPHLLYAAPVFVILKNADSEQRQKSVRWVSFFPSFLWCSSAWIRIRIQQLDKKNDSLQPVFIKGLPVLD